jgi:hypothetical protein
MIGGGDYALLSVPVLARIFFERREVTDEFIAEVVSRWRSNTTRTIVSADVPLADE